MIDIPTNTLNKVVYLALPVARSGAVNVGDNIRLRYSCFEDQVFDTTRAQNDAVTLELAKLNVVLKLEGEELQDYTLLPVAQVSEYRPETGVILNQAFVPNCLYFGVSHDLKDCLADVYVQMQYRATTIHLRLNVENASKSYQALMRDYLWLQILGSWMPRVKHWINDNSFSTKNLYVELISMAGQMQGLEGKMPKEFAAWNRNDLYSIFSQVFAELLLLLREVQIDNVTQLIWDTSLFAKRRLLRTIVHDRSLYNDGRFILVATSNIGFAKLSEEFPKAAKLAGNSDIAVLARNGLSGIALRNLPYAPSELKAKSDAAYFEVDTQSDLWLSLIKKDEPIALHIDECIEDIFVEFYVIR